MRYRNYVIFSNPGFRGLPVCPWRGVGYIEPSSILRISRKYAYSRAPYAIFRFRDPPLAHVGIRGPPSGHQVCRVGTLGKETKKPKRCISRKYADSSLFYAIFSPRENPMASLMGNWVSEPDAPTWPHLMRTDVPGIARKFTDAKIQQWRAMGPNGPS